MVQITKCLCGATIAACSEPFCYTDAEYQRDTRSYLKKGYAVEMVENGGWNFEKCTCNEIKIEEVNKNQLSLF